jgi:hypothetical protein
MKQSVFKSIEKSISSARLSTYANHSKNNTELVVNYVLNAKISENFYFLLQNLEVSLRNAIYDGFKLHYPTDDFFYLHETNPKNRYLSRHEIHDRECWKMLCGAKHSLRNITINDGKIIAELNFGFWTKLLLSTDKKYTKLWRQIFSEVFPHYTIVHSIDHDKGIIGKKIDAVRLLRNRIFHYEPIFNYPNLEQIHKDIVDILGWINKDMQNLSLIFDEFDFTNANKSFIQKHLRGNLPNKRKKIKFRRKKL